MPTSTSSSRIRPPGAEFHARQRLRIDRRQRHPLGEPFELCVKLAQSCGQAIEVIRLLGREHIEVTSAPGGAMQSSPYSPHHDVVDAMAAQGLDDVLFIQRRSIIIAHCLLA